MMASTETNPCWINDKLPAPTVSSYETKGKWEQIGDLKSYIVGPQTSKRALLVIYDAFGISPPGMQGVDRLSEHLDALVVQPDFLGDKAPDHDKFLADPAGYRPIMTEFMQTYGNVNKNAKIVLDFMQTLKSRFPDVEKWGAFGLCWGGKVAVLASQENTPFAASGQTHPGRMAVEDAQALTIPHICMPSKDEPADIVDEYEKILAEKKLGVVERFPTMFHGWMGARALLDDKEHCEEYERGYRVAAEFFAKHL